MMLSDDYVKAIDWIFSNTECKLIMTCLVGVGHKDREIYHYLHDHRKQIDRATGESVYFIYPVEGKLMSCSESPVFIRDKKAYRFNDLDGRDNHLLLDRITDAIYDECPKIFPFDYYELPGLVFIDRKKFPKFVPIKSIDEIDLYIDAFGILDSFLRDYSRCDEELRELSKKHIKEKVEKELAELREEKQARFSNIEISNVNILPEIESILRDYDVEDDDINSLRTHNKLNIYLGQLFNKYPDLVHSDKLRELSKLARKQNQVESLEKRISTVERLLEDSVSRSEIEAKRAKQKEILDNYIIKLTRILLDEQASENILMGLLFPLKKERMLFSLIDLIKERTSTILNRIKTVEAKVDSLGYDIFISCKSQDYNNAHNLHDFLQRNGHRPFIADYALREIGTDKYGEIIRHVIDRCSYMIVFATDIDYINTEYVRHEWNLFYDEVMAGRKNGRLYAVIPSLSLIPEMPIVFRNTQCFEIHSVEETILDFVKPIGE